MQNTQLLKNQENHPKHAKKAKDGKTQNMSKTSNNFSKNM